MRSMVKEDGFPVENYGTNGVPYEFDPCKVKAWQEENEAKLEAERDGPPRADRPDDA